jgi:hypothetical protein
MTVTTSTPPEVTTMAEPPKAMVIDSVQDRFDASLAAFAIVNAPPDATYDAALALDFLEIHTPLLTASFFLRDLPARVLGRPRPPVPARMSLGSDEGPTLPGWMILGKEPDREVVFGAVGRFWTPTITWNDQVVPEQFASFDEPGWGKLACNFATFPYGTHRTLLGYECRTLVTDAESRRLFNRYWRLVRPFVGHVLRATVRTIRDEVEAAGHR